MDGKTVEANCGGGPGSGRLGEPGLGNFKAGEDGPAVPVTKLAATRWGGEMLLGMQAAAPGAMGWGGVTCPGEQERAASPEASNKPGQAAGEAAQVSGEHGEPQPAFRCSTAATIQCNPGR